MLKVSDTFIIGVISKFNFYTIDNFNKTKQKKQNKNKNKIM